MEVYGRESGHLAGWFDSTAPILIVSIVAFLSVSSKSKLEKSIDL